MEGDKKSRILNNCLKFNDELINENIYYSLENIYRRNVKHMAEIENKIIKANKGDSLNELRYLIKYLRSYFLNMLDKVQPEPDYWYSELP